MESLVTGGAGFIGSHLVEALVERGDAVRVLDDFSTGRMANLGRVASKIDVIRGDIRDRATVREAANGVDTVFHQAALVSVPLSVADPATNHAINVDGTFNLLEAARLEGVTCFVYASSAAVYGDSTILPKVETMPTEPVSPYGLAKSIGEQYAQLYTRVYGLRTVGLRYFNVYGPRQDPGSPYSGVISIFIDRLLAGVAPTIYGDGSQTRDFIYVSDVVRANVLAAETPAASGHVLNICTSRPSTILELWDTLQAFGHTDLAPEFADERPGDVKHSWASFEKAHHLLGFAPRVGLAQGLQRTVKWYRTGDDRR